MSKTEALRELYNVCKELNFDDSSELAMEAKSEDEAAFFRVVTDYILQQKQKKIIAEKRF